MPPTRADAQRRDRNVDARSGEHAEVARRRRHEIGDLRDVAARLLHADDVRVRRQRAPTAAGSRFTPVTAVKL